MEQSLPRRASFDSRLNEVDTEQRLASHQRSCDTQFEGKCRHLESKYMTKYFAGALFGGIETSSFKIQGVPLR
jgi:hypothetical protein